MITQLLGIGALLYSQFVVPEVRNIELDDSVFAGSCDGSHGGVDLLHLMRIENETVFLEMNRHPHRIDLREQFISIYRVEEGRDEITYSANVGELVADDRGTADVFIRLAVLNGAFLLYWRETYQHRIYRQGLFRIFPTHLETLCEGRGGSWRSH